LCNRLKRNRQRFPGPRSGVAIDVQTMPPLEHDELPQLERVIALPGDMFLHQSTDKGRLKVAACETAGRKQGVGKELAKTAPKPY
jgi:hypothetical protein